MRNQHVYLRKPDSRSRQVALPAAGARLWHDVTGFCLILAAAILCITGLRTAHAAAVDAPSDMPVSPLFGATDFSQSMLRFEEFDVEPMTAPGTNPPKTLPPPLATATEVDPCRGSPDDAAMDAFLAAPLWPDPTEAANTSLLYDTDGDTVLDASNPWTAFINGCIPGAITTGVAEGRPPGINYSHQRWTEFPPAMVLETAMGQARPGTGRLDSKQSHGYAVGEFGPRVAGKENETGLYHNVVGLPGLFPDGTTAGIAIRLHPNLPIQNPLNLWTFGDGTLPPKLLRARYGLPILLRNYNVLPIDVTANGFGVIGFGEHTITTHEHNGHQPGESDGFAGAYFFPGEFYDYRWPMQLAGYDSINTDRSDPRAATPCAPGEVLPISDPATGAPVNVTCDPVTLTARIAGDWHETMSTHWFHDHMIDRTSENVYKGNAAMMNYYSAIDRGEEGFRCNYADPANNVNLCFPSGTAKHWGNRDYDVQLLVADKAWNPTNGQLAMADQALHEDGFLADRMTVNWLYKPYFDVRARKYRFRILNGSVARFFKIAIVREFNDATSGDFPGLPGTNRSYSRVPFHMIGNDGNIMEHAVKFPNAQSNDLPMQCIAERYDIIVDFSQFPAGTKLYMVNTVEHRTGRGPDAVIPLGQILNGTYVATPTLAGCTDHCWNNDPTIGKFLEFRVQPYSGTDLSMNPADYEVGKKTMIPLVKITDAELAAAKHRTMHFGRGGGQADDLRPTPWTVEVDGTGALNANLNRVYAAPETMGGGWEIWHLTSGGGWGHPIHIHFEESQYLQRSDGPGTERQPPLWEQGARKDMYRVSNLGEGPLGLPDSSLNIDVAIRFREFAGTFVEHCHNTTHEDKAMLIRWDNEVPGQTIRIPTPIPDWDGVTYVSATNPYTHLPSTEAGLPGTVGTFPNLSQTAVVEVPTLKTGSGVPAGYVSPLQLSADLNWDGLVNIPDLGIFKSHFGFLGGFWSGDLNEDMRINIPDLGIFKSQFGQNTGIPRPNNNPFCVPGPAPCPTL